jgi:RNAse (barnase) inhibitor barstar
MAQRPFTNFSHTMASFGDDPSEWQRLDWRLLLHGPIALYYRPAILDEDVAWLQSANYQIDEFDAARWASAEIFHAEIARQLRFPAYYGRNLDAFNDSLSDIDVPLDGGRCLVFRHFDAVARRDPPFAQAILDIIGTQSRHFLLRGRRFLALAQCDDPRATFEPVGACPVWWNPREWLDSNRTALVG